MIEEKSVTFAMANHRIIIKVSVILPQFCAKARNSPKVNLIDKESYFSSLCFFAGHRLYIDSWWSVSPHKQS